MTADPFLVRQIVREGTARYGTGYRYGDLTVSRETWELIVRFTLDMAEDLQESARLSRGMESTGGEERAKKYESTVVGDRAVRAEST